MPVVEETRTPEQLNAVRGLIRAFVAWHRETHVSDLELIDRYFDEDQFETELRGLPGKYAPPAGGLLWCSCDGTPAGCVTMCDLGDGACEMKRMFVRPDFRRLGVGLALAENIIASARRVGFRRMQLDTSIRQIQAMALYERFGFRRTEPNRNLPRDLRDWLVFFELPL